MFDFLEQDIRWRVEPCKIVDLGIQQADRSTGFTIVWLVGGAIHRRCGRFIFSCDSCSKINLLPVLFAR